MKGSREKHAFPSLLFEFPGLPSGNSCEGLSTLPLAMTLVKQMVPS